MSPFILVFPKNYINIKQALICLIPRGLTSAQSSGIMPDPHIMLRVISKESSREHVDIVKNQVTVGELFGFVFNMLGEKGCIFTLQHFKSDNRTY